MNKVYILIGCIDDQRGSFYEEILGVFLTKELADEAIKEFSDIKYNCGFIIDHWDVKNNDM